MQPEDEKVVEETAAEVVARDPGPARLLGRPVTRRSDFLEFFRGCSLLSR